MAHFFGAPIGKLLYGQLSIFFAVSLQILLKRGVDVYLDHFLGGTGVGLLLGHGDKQGGGTFRGGGLSQ